MQKVVLACLSFGHLLSAYHIYFIFITYDSSLLKLSKILHLNHDIFLLEFVPRSIKCLKNVLVV